LFLSWIGHYVDVHSFPTRRSSDLGRIMSKVRLVLLNIVLVLISMLGAVLIMVDFKKSVLSEFLERESWIQIIIAVVVLVVLDTGDRKSTRLNSSHVSISYAVFCLK